MKKAWLKIKNGFLSYSRSDRVGIMILSILIFILLGIKAYIKRIPPEPYYTKEQFDEIQLQWNTILQENERDPERGKRLFIFNPNTIPEETLDSLKLPLPIKSNLIKYRDAGGTFKSINDLQKLYGMTDSIFRQIAPFVAIPQKKPRLQTGNVKKIEADISGFFDPNTASLNELKKYGLNSFQAKNIVSYRESGGSYYQPEDLLKIYGLDSVTFKRIYPYLKIDVVLEPEKIVTIQQISIELNTADTTELVKLKGIGPVFASRIIKYRNLLGGYHHRKQLLEVYGFSEEMYRSVESFVTIDTTKIEQIRINYAGFSEMVRHPYFNKSNVSAILNEKDKKGPIRNLYELERLEAIDREFIEKVKPYVSCR